MVLTNLTNESMRDPSTIVETAKMIASHPECPGKSAIVAEAINDANRMHKTGEINEQTKDEVITILRKI